MSNLSPLGGRASAGLPVPARGDTVASYRTYLEAQRAVDYLSDQNFPVQAVTIVGVDLQMVERVIGRLTYPRVALSGLATGAWWGLFVGLLLQIASDAATGQWIFAIPLGAAFGMAFALFAYALTGGRRDFTSTSQIVAGEYRVLCLSEQAGQALQLLRRLEGGTGIYSGQEPTATAPVTPAAPGPATGPSVGAPARDGGAAPQQPPVAPSGPTYGDMIDRKRREEREARERAQG